MVSKGRNLVTDAGITAPLFAAPSVAPAVGAVAEGVAGEGGAGDGSLIIRSAEPLAGHNATEGSAARIERLLVMARPAGLDAGEITDKGYVNQRQVLANRAALVELLYTEPVPAGVVVAERTA